MDYDEDEKKKIAQLSTIQRLILCQLECGAKNIINGNCRFIDDKEKEILDIISLLISPTRLLSKYQVAKELKVSQKQVERYVNEGKLAKPISQQGFKEKGWRRLDVEKTKCLLNR